MQCFWNPKLRLLRGVECPRIKVYNTHALGTLASTRRWCRNDCVRSCSADDRWERPGGCSVCSCVSSLAWTAGGHPNQMLVFIPPGFSHDMESLTNEEVVLEVFKVRAMPVCPCGTACTHGCIGAAAGTGTIASPSWTMHHPCHLAWRPPQDLSLLLRRTTAFLQQT